MYFYYILLYFQKNLKIMKKQYIFLILIIIMLYEIFLIFNYKYKEYKINSNMEYIEKINEETRQSIKYAEDLIIYKKSKAYKNKIIKEQQSLKNKWETVIYLTSEKKYNTFTKEIVETDEVITDIKDMWNNITTNMTIYQKWIYFLFKKDIR